MIFSNAKVISNAGKCQFFLKMTGNISDNLTDKILRGLVLIVCKL